MSLPANTWYMLSPKLTMAHTNTDHPRLATHEKSRIFNLSSALPTSTIISFTNIPESQFLYVSYLQGTLAFSNECHLPLKHLKRLSPQLWSLPIRSWHSNYSWDWHSDYALAAVLSIQLLMWLAQIASILDFFCPGTNLMSTTKSYSQFLKLSNNGNITLKALDFQSIKSLITEFAILFNDQNPHTSTSTLVWILSDSLVICFCPGKLRTNLMHSLTMDIYLKERNSNYAVQSQTTTYSLLSNHIVLWATTYQSQSSMDLSSWMLKGSQSQLQEDPISAEPQQSVRPQWPLIQCLLCHLDASISELQQSPTMCSPVSHDLPLQVILVRQRPFIKSHAYYCPDFQSMSRTTAWCYHCSHVKPVHHKPYNFSSNFNSQEALDSISMYFLEKLPPSPVTPWF